MLLGEMKRIAEQGKKTNKTSTAAQCTLHSRPNQFPVNA